MLVAITGATGFVGSHTVAAALAAGHRVRAVVRNPSLVPSALEPLGVDPASVDVAVADVLDRQALGAALDGADALVHAASIYSFDPRRGREIESVAVSGVRNALELAVERQLDPIVHVSSVVALLPGGPGPVSVGPASPPGDSPFPYCRSKANQEALAQELQATGAPVTIVNPGAVWGPYDPHGGESVAMARNALAGKLRFAPQASLPIVDVRDVAQVLTRTLEAGLGPRRFMAGGHRVQVDRIVELVTEAAGRRRRTHAIPKPMARVAGGVGSLCRRTLGIDLGVSQEQVWILLQDMHVDDRDSVHRLGVTFRPPEEAIVDQVRWMLGDERAAEVGA